MSDITPFLNHNECGESFRLYTLIPDTKEVRCIRLNMVPNTTRIMDKEFVHGARMFSSYKKVGGKWEFAGGFGWNFVEDAVTGDSNLIYVNYEEGK